ncbi:helix-turn-helix transcriptional regulator [Chryseobacterium sp. C39-AII1]|uniref:helix-turn-helix domain-containing protein n=1 Tax=Chryseobacterium sp. C39-AII1 TaxID=3080332 RepID=UPI003209DA3A
MKKKSMTSIGEIIIASRKNKNLTQEQLADLSKVNLRTIQRIENNENMPRENTLKLICDTLEISIPKAESSSIEKPLNFIEIGFKYFSLIIINLALMAIIGWMTLDSEANLNSRFAGLLLSFLLPISIVFFTLKTSRTQRLLKFGSGFLVYIVLAIVTVGFPTAFVTGLLPCLSICLLTLFYGDSLLFKKIAAGE